MGVNDYFGPIRTNRPHATPNQGHRKLNSKMYYYRQTYCFPEKLTHIKDNLEKHVKK